MGETRPDGTHRLRASGRTPRPPTWARPGRSCCSVPSSGRFQPRHLRAPGPAGLRAPFTAAAPPFTGTPLRALSMRPSRTEKETAPSDAARAKRPATPRDGAAGEADRPGERAPAARGARAERPPPNQAVPAGLPVGARGRAAGAIPGGRCSGQPARPCPPVLS